MSGQRAGRATEAATLLASEVFLILMTLTALAGFSRLFVDRTWVDTLVVAAVVAHVTVAVVRRFGRGLMLSGAVATMAMVLQISWTHYRPTLRAGLPSGATRAAVDTDLTAAWNLFSEVKAPTEPAIGFLVVASVALWVIAYLADWAAFRLWSPVETMLPSFALFVFVAFFGEPENRLALAALFLAAVIGFQLFHRLMRQSQEVRWLAGTQAAGTSAITRTGAVVSVVVVLGALVVGPVLPGAERDPIVDLDARNDGPDTRVVISPIVDIRGRLVEQADVEAFTVVADRPSYWRLASLDSFNGQIWGADTKYGKASGGLPDDFEVDAEVEVNTQQFVIANMGAVWIPAAYEPRRIVTSSDDAISYEAVSGTLIVGRDLETSNGLTYTIESAMPTFDPEALAAAPDLYPQEIIDRYLDLPADFSPLAREVARTIVDDAGATNDYEEALALQNYFRDNFDYDLEVGAGHSSARIDEFLSSGVGYCEQFAGSFAAMARSLNIPARVAVGFTWGELDPFIPNQYHVRGEHAHAWPEVYIPGSGWVPFEPTPTRGAPNAQRWTQVVAAQAGGTGVDEPTPLGVPTPAAGAPVQPEEFDPSRVEVPPEDAASGVADESGGVPGWLRVVGLVVLTAAALAALYVASMLFAKRARARRRFTRATTNRARVNAVWTETVESLRPLGLTMERSETVAEFVDRAGKDHKPARDHLAGLGSLTIAAKYGPQEPGDDAVATAVVHRDGVVATVNSLTTTTERLRDSLDPRPLVRNGGA